MAAFGYHVFAYQRQSAGLRGNSFAGSNERFHVPVGLVTSGSTLAAEDLQRVANAVRESGVVSLRQV